MGKKRKVLSLEEIWDDSALIESWDDAVEEYKLYHSIHARGESVEDALFSAAQDQQMTNDHSLLVDEGTSQPNYRVGDESLEDGELEGTEAAMSNNLQPDKEHEEMPSTKPRIPIRRPDTTSPQLTQNLSSIPEGVIAASTQEEAQKNLMMSWYWAGYYTGFYEGQKQASGSA